MSTPVRAPLAFLLIAGVLLLSGCPVGSPPVDDDDAVQEVDPALDAALQAALEGMVEESPAAGLTATIELADGAVWTGAAGSTHPDERDGSRPMIADDLFNIASITKSFTAGLVLTLVDEGLLALDDSFEAWVPGGHARGAEISLRQLLKHTAGVPEHTMTSEFQANYTASWTDEELLALVAGLDLVNEPGAAAAYSNSHFVMLSLVVSAATGVPWREALVERVLVPLGLEDTTAPGLGDDWGEVVPTWLGGSPFPSILHPTGPGAAGCMVSDGDDVARWTRARFGGDFLSPELTTSQVEDLEPLGGPFFLGLGALIVDSSENALEWGHNGALNGYVGWSGYRPDIDASISLLGNACGAGNPPEFSYPLGLHLDLWAEVDAHLAAER